MTNDAVSFRTSLRDRLHRAGLRLTNQREQLAGLLFRDGFRHVTAEALHREAAQAGIGVSLATVYNTLHQFTGAGLLREVVVESGRSYFDTNTSAHHHFFNTASRELTDIPLESVAVGELPAAPEGTVVDGVEVVIRVTPG